jgi:hypothetical protein
MTIIRFEFMKVIKWIAFWGIHQNGKDCLYKWKFLSLALKNATIEFQKVMDQVLVGLAFTKCYIEDVICNQFYILLS